MSIFSTIASFQSPLILLLIIFGPTLLPRLIKFFRPAPPSLIPKTPQTPRPISLKSILGIHTLYILKQLIEPPYNLFTNNNLPISISNSQIRYIILGKEASIENIHPLLELILTRLKVMENRLSYLKFGHESLMECIWCQNEIDYLIYSIPNILSWYLNEAVFLGVIGWTWLAGEQAKIRADTWRISFGWSLVVGAVLEIGTKWIWDLRVIEGDALHLASIIHTLRCISFLLFPLIYTFLPLPSTQISPQTLSSIISNTTSTLRLTSLARNAIQRSTKLREIWTNVGKRDAERNEIAKRDEEVRELVKLLNMDEDTMRFGAKGWIREGWNGMVRVDSEQKGI